MEPQPEVSQGQSPDPQLPTLRNYAIPHCHLQIACEQDDGLPVSEVLAIVFSIAHSNPEAKLDFWLKVMPPAE